MSGSRSNGFKAKGIKFTLDDHKFKIACIFAPIWYAHAEFFPWNGDPVPRTFGRHPSAHAVSRTQYSRNNVVYALTLVTSVIKFFDTQRNACCALLGPSRATGRRAWRRCLDGFHDESGQPCLLLGE